eukprot:10425105-Ditylum_brightwellii.AAC.1
MRPEYRQFQFCHFKVNLKNLCEVIGKEKIAQEHARNNDNNDNNNNKPKWRKSEAKKHLCIAILAGTICNDMLVEQVYEMHPEFKKFQLKHFKTSLKNLCENIVKDRAQMQTDRKAY